MVGSARTIAVSPFFNSMVFTTQIVKHRIYVSKNNVSMFEKLRTHKAADALLSIVNATQFVQKSVLFLHLGDYITLISVS